MGEITEIGLEVAVIGMAGRFPGARYINEFWENLKHGVESIYFFTDEELKEAGVKPGLLENPNYVKAHGVIEDIGYFDAAFFGYTPKEAEVMDPQIRIFHECVWETLEDAGYNIETYEGLIGLYAGATSMIDWEARTLLSGKSREVGDFAAIQLSKKDYLTLRISYKLNLIGPSFVLYTACSTSLVAVHLACQAILNGECDMALAGGVSILRLENTGYIYEEGMISSADGHCRAFDAGATGIIGGDGVGVVLLKRLEDALADRDYIYAVVKGSAVNNDGIRKAGFTAPSVVGQAEVIKMALQGAEVEAETIGYVETHGTATELGDPVEIEGLKLAFNTNKKGFCGIGSVKTNVGHLDAAAGVTGFIKTVLALKHQLIPPSVNFESPNPRLDLIDSPFYVNAALKEWETNGYSRRAGVSSFGLGGTNAHVILEEFTQQTRGLAPLSAGKVPGQGRGGVAPPGQSPQYQLILLSAKTETALRQMMQNLAEYFKKNLLNRGNHKNPTNPGPTLADAAYTLKMGRKDFKHRWMTVCSTMDEAIEALTSPGGGETYTVSPQEESSTFEKAENSGDKNTLIQLGRLWLHGHNPDWREFYSREKRFRVPLPTYSFEGQRYWIEGNPFKMGWERLNQNSQVNTHPDIGDWFYVPSWKRSIPGTNPRKNRSLWLKSKYRWLVFVKELNPELTNLLAKKLKEKEQDVVMVKRGNAFTQERDNVYTVNPHKSSHYDLLFSDLLAKNRIPDKIIHCWNVTGETGIPWDNQSFDEAQALGFYSLFYIAKTIGNRNVRNDIHIVLLTDHLQEVIGGEQLCPGKAPALGLVKAIPQEYPGISCRNIDIQLPQPGSLEAAGLIDTLLEEFSTESPDPVMAIRNNQCWVESFEPFPLLSCEYREKLGEPTGTRLLELKEQGVYLITGGLGKIGFMFCQLLVKQVNARLVLTGRSLFPAREDWNQWLESHEPENPICQKIKRLQVLEEMGGKVCYFQADVTNIEQMNKAVTQAEETFGKIDGVIYLAGVNEGLSMRPIRDLTESDCQLQFQSKAYGLLVLWKLFKNRQPDFCWLQSSISCVLAGLGFGAYASANLFMDVFVKRQNQSMSSGPPPPRWFAINWDGMDDKQSTIAFERIFSLEKTKIHQLVFSNGGNLQQRIDRWIKLESVRGRDEFRAGVEEISSLYPRPDLSTPYEAPRSPAEKAVANIWTGILGYDEIGIKDDFLELGGDSLKSITILSRIHQELKVNVPLREFFSKPTVENIARYISANNKEDKYVYIAPTEKKEFYPASSAQKRLYVLQQMEKEAVTYSMSYVLKLEDEFDKNRLEDAFKKMIRRHESLKTSFELHDGKVIQRIYPVVKFTLEFFKGVSKEAAAGTVNNFLRPFDLSVAPLFRVGLIELEEKSHILMVDMHHIISDGISLEITVRNFMMLYKGEELPPLTLQYKDFSQWQNLEKENSTIIKQEEYWLKEFAGNIPQLVLPYDYSRPKVRGFEGEAIEFEIGENETKRLKELAANEDATLFMTLLAIYYILLWELGGQEDIVVGTGTAGRRKEELQEIIGLFVNTLPLRNYPKKEKTFRGFLKEIKERTLQAFENQDYQFEDLVEKVVLNRDPGRNPLFDAVIVSQNVILTSGSGRESDKPGSPQLNLKPMDFAPKISKFDISLLCTPAGNQYQFTIEYSTKLFKKETIERYEVYFKEIIIQVLENNDIKLEEIAVSHHLLSATGDNPEMELGF